MTEKFNLPLLYTGVPGLDALLGGGLPELSFNLIAGAPGTGKTTLAHQMMFALAGPGKRAIFFTVLGEPTLKMLRYQQQYTFFDTRALDGDVRYVNLGDEVRDGNFELVLARIMREVEEFEPSFVFVDSFRSVAHAAQNQHTGVPALQEFVQRLGMFLTSWQATTFLIGEYMSPDGEANPVFTIADGILWLSQVVQRDSSVRKVQITKMRGQSQLTGLHTFRITNAGLEIFPRTLGIRTNSGDGGPRPLLSMGNPILDEMLGGGLPAGFSLLVSGPSGAGKTILASEFLAEGARQGEAGVVLAFESARNPRLDALVTQGKVRVIDTRALDLSVDETLHSLSEAVRETGATRVVIDSFSGFELALSPSFREDFREVMHRMVAVLTSMGVTVVLVSELEDRYTDLRFSPYGAAFLTDAIVVQRYVELAGKLKRVLAVVKVRNRSHSHALRMYKVTDEGLAIGEAWTGFDGLLTGSPSQFPRPAISLGPA